MSDSFPPPLAPGTPPVLPHDEVARRRTGLWAQLLWAPVVALGAILTISLFGAIMGLPLLAVSIPPLLAGRRRWRGRAAPLTFIAIGVLGIAALIAYGAWYLLDNGDLDSSDDGFDLADLAAWSALAAWSGATLWTTVRLRRR